MNKPSPESQGGLSDIHCDPVSPVRTLEAYIRYEGNDMMYGSAYSVRTDVGFVVDSSWKKCIVFIYD